MNRLIRVLNIISDSKQKKWVNVTMIISMVLMRVIGDIIRSIIIRKRDVYEWL